MIRSQKIKGTFIFGPLFFKWMGVFQSSLDCFSIGVGAFVQNINFSSSVYTGAYLFRYLNTVISSLITRFFKCIKLHQILFQLPTINLAQVLEIKIFGRDYSNLNNIFQRY